MRYLHAIALLLTLSTSWALDIPVMIERCPCEGNAPNWAEDTRFMGNWKFDEPYPQVQNLADASTHSNPLSNNATTSSTFGKQTPMEGCLGITKGSTNNAIACQIGDGCTVGDFCFPGGDFTAGLWVNPSEQWVSGTMERWTLSTDASEGGLGAGWNMGFMQTGSGSGKYLFQMDPLTENEVLTASSYSVDEWHHHVARYTVGTTTMEQVIDGITDANTATSASPASCDDFTIGVGGSSRCLLGSYDDAWVFDGLLSNEDICRIAVCGVTGCDCTCNGTTWITYKKHADQGGPLTCTLPTACNKATPD